MKTNSNKADLKNIKPLSRAQQTKVMGGVVSTESDHAHHDINTVHTVKVFGMNLKDKITKQ